MTSDHGSETGRQNIPAAGSAHTNEYMNGTAAGAAPHRASPSDMNSSDNGEDRIRPVPAHERRATSSPSEAARTDYAHARSSDAHRAPYGYKSRAATNKVSTVRRDSAANNGIAVNRGAATADVHSVAAAHGTPTVRRTSPARHANTPETQSAPNVSMANRARPEMPHTPDASRAYGAAAASTRRNAYPSPQALRDPAAQHNDKLMPHKSDNQTALRTESSRRGMIDRIIAKFPLAAKPAFAVPVSALVLLIVIFTAFILICSRPITVEVGETPDYSHLKDSSFMRLVCTVETDTDAIDTAKPGKVSASLKFFGFIKSHSTLRIVDTVSPVIGPQDVCVTSNAEIDGRMFAKTVVDKTDVSFEITSEIEKGEVKNAPVSVRATDEGGNYVDFEASLTVVDPGDTLVFEYGVTKEVITEHILSVLPDMKNLDFSAVEEYGDFFVTGNSGDTAYFALITVADTVAPVAKLASFDTVVGQAIDEADIIVSIDDYSEVTYEFLKRADYNKPGEYQIAVRFTDAPGNTSEYTSVIRVHDIETDVTIEINSSDEELYNHIFKDSWSRDKLTFVSENVIAGLVLGEYSLSLSGEYSSIPIYCNIVDTTPPDFTVSAQSYPVGVTPNAADFVVSCTDATKVTYAFAQAPKNSADGTFPVVITATDTSGNTAQQETRITFFYDLTPPVISGWYDVSLKYGQSYNFAYGVTAYDSVWGDVKVKTDASAVDPWTPGTYTVTYTATDGSGNTATQTITVTVREPVRVCLNVSNIMQKPALPNGCEVVSLAIVLRYAGYSADPVAIYDEFMPKSPYADGDPWTTYVGNAKGRGLGCYAPCVVTTGNAYLASVGSSQKVCDVSGQNLSYYESLIDGGTPVILWGTVKMNGNSRVWWTGNIDGKTVKWHYDSHCMVLIGYTDYTYIFCDPLRGTVEYDKEDVEKSFAVNYRQACIVK